MLAVDRRVRIRTRFEPVWVIGTLQILAASTALGCLDPHGLYQRLHMTPAYSSSIGSQ